MSYLQRSFVLVGVMLGLCLSLSTAQAASGDFDTSQLMAPSFISPQSVVSQGAFSYSIPFTVPLGRQGMTPDLNLSYSSRDLNDASWFGAGWSLSIPVIERLNTYGSEQLYANTTFTTTLGGELKPISLSDGVHGGYGLKVDDGSFLQFDFQTSDKWVITDKMGKTYTFGSSTDGRVVHPTTATQIYRWMLEEVRDTSGNYITYTYAKEGNNTYPSTITYTSYGTTAGPFVVTFLRETRPDVQTTNLPGFEVETAKRISEVQMSVSGVLRHRYVLSYTTGDAAGRSLLSSVTETGYDASGVATTLPATTLTYQDATVSWSASTSYTYPFVIAGYNESRATFLFDVNGDGLDDFVRSHSGTQKVFINDGDGTEWTEDTNYTVPVVFGDTNGNDFGVRVGDVNGDGFQDLIQAYYPGGSLVDNVYINNADGTGWTLDASIAVPQAFANGPGDAGVRIVDINADGLDDIVLAKDSAQAVYINNGDSTGWTQDTGWIMPVSFSNSSGKDQGVRFVDFNNDGLVDLLKAKYEPSLTAGLYINNGRGWDLQTGIGIPIGFTNDFGYDQGVRLFDINADGAIDIVQSKTNGTTITQGVYVNKNDGTGWYLDSGLTASLPTYFVNSDLGLDNGVRLTDVDGDGRTDIIKSHYTGASVQEETWIADGTLGTDYLASYTNPAGGSGSLTYGTAREFGSGNTVPFTVSVLRTHTTDDGVGPDRVTTYSYHDADFYYADEYDRAFAGFGRIEETDSVGMVTKRYFHQGNSTNSSLGEAADSWEKMYRQYREERLNGVGNKYRVTIDGWQSTSLGSGRSFPYRSASLAMDYDGDTDHRDTATEYTFDTANGNLLTQLFLGEVIGNDNGTYADTGTDSIKTEYDYATHASGLVRGAVESELVRNHTLGLEKSTTYFYDNLSLGSVDKGNITKKQEWISGSEYADTEMTYSSQGLVLTVEDAEDSLTTYTYDATHPLQSLTETNHLNQVTSYAYDLATGQVTQKTLPNTSIFQTTYDGLGRPLTEKQSSPTVAATLETVATYVYNNSSVPNSVQETRYLDGSTTVDTYTYVDGFGRPVQTRKEHETSNHYSVSDTIYDGLGRVEKVSLPYDATGSAYSSPTATADLLETYTYDALDRVTSVVNAAGTTTSSYDQWVTTEFDANNEEKEYTYDARGLLVSVQENSGASDFITSYLYSTLGNLTRFTDSWGHLRNFTYDKLGRRLTAEDLHASTDTAFGTWSYTYDKVGNMLTTTDANGKVITNTYDDLHRILTENDPAVAGTEMTYTYDTGCTNGVSQLCLATGNNGVITDYDYDLLGRATSVAQTVDATVRTTTNTYNRRGDLLITTHPDGSKQEFTYGTAGRVASAGWRTTSGVFKPLLSSATYSPMGSPEVVTLANGVVTTYDYNETELYRLANKKSVKGATEFQDFTYTYDDAGNITNIVDAPTIYAQVTHVMTYNDLHRLTNVVSTSTTAALAGTRTIDYTRVGNITSMTGVGSYSYNHAGAGVYANPHAPTTVGTKTLTYDKNGNLLTDGTWTNTWDYKNRMVTSAKTGNTVSYLYDHTGRRVKKTDTTTAVPTYYVDGAYEIEGTRKQHHVTVPGIGLLATTTSTTVNTYAYHLTDHLGSPHAEVDGGGALLRYQVYEPYGKIRYSSGSYSTDYKFTGKEQDTETSLQYFGARYYDNTRGQFTSSDPVFLALGSPIENERLDALLRDPQMWNSYAYGRSNPYRMVDPDGMWAVNWRRALHSAANVSTKFLNTATSIVPGVSDFRDVIEVTTGRNTFTGQRLTALDYAVTIGAAALPIASGSSARSVVSKITDASLSAGRRAIVSQLDNAAGKTINGSVTIPANWTRVSTRGAGGHMYINPANSEENIRLMPGRGNARHETSRNPYWRHEVEGGYLDANGNINHDPAKTHFPIESIE